MRVNLLCVAHSVLLFIALVVQSVSIVPRFPASSPLAPTRAALFLVRSLLACLQCLLVTVALSQGCSSLLEALRHALLSEIFKDLDQPCLA